VFDQVTPKFEEMEKNKAILESLLVKKDKLDARIRELEKYMKSELELVDKKLRTFPQRNLN